MQRQPPVVHATDEEGSSGMRLFCNETHFHIHKIPFFHDFFPKDHLFECGSLQAHFRPREVINTTGLAVSITVRLPLQ